MRQGYEKLDKNHLLEKEDVGFDEICRYLIAEGNIEPPVSDKSTIEMTPSPQKAIRVDGESSGETYVSLIANRASSNKMWEEYRDKEEKRRMREYSILGFLILFLAVLIQASQLLV